MDKLKCEVDTVKENQYVCELDLSAVAGKVDEVVDRLDQVEEEADRLEAFSRRDNVVLYGIEDEHGESFDRCKDKVLNILNSNMSEKQWTRNDIVRAHRVTGNWSGAPRPMIVKFHH